MAKEEKRVLTLDKYEHGVVINALNEMRNDLIGENRPTDAVDDVLLKAIDAPTRTTSTSTVSRSSAWSIPNWAVIRRIILRSYTASILM